MKEFLYLNDVMWKCYNHFFDCSIKFFWNLLYETKIKKQAIKLIPDTKNGSLNHKLKINPEETAPMKDPIALNPF